TRSPRPGAEVEPLRISLHCAAGPTGLAAGSMLRGTASNGAAMGHKRRGNPEQGHGHSFGRARPSQGGRHSIHRTPEPDTYFRDLPRPTGQKPFHLDLKSVLPHADYQAIVQAKRLVFHVNGDTGGISNAMEQRLVARGMEADVTAQKG